MSSFLGILFFLPCIVCLFWTPFYFFRVKAITQQLMMVLLVLCAFYFVAFAFYISPQTDYVVMAWLDLFNVPVSLVLLAVDLIFVWTHHDRRLLESRLHLLIYVPALVLTSISCLIYSLIGIDEVARFSEALDHYGHFPPGFEEGYFELYYKFNLYALSPVMFAYVLIICGCCCLFTWRHGYRLGHVFRFLFCGLESKPIRVICFLNGLTLCLLIPMVPQEDMGRTYLLNHPTIGIILSLMLSVVLFCLVYVEYMIDLPRFTLSALAQVNFAKADSPSLKETEPVVVTEAGPAAPIPVSTSKPETKPTPAQRPSPASTPVIVTPALVDALRKAFDVDRVYTDPNLSIISLASRLHSNRTTLSSIIMLTYGMNFRQLVAQHRIEAAQRYMLANPEARQDEVAMECGFLTAQAFNQKFKELIGEAPRVWMLRNEK